MRLRFFLACFVLRRVYGGIFNDMIVDYFDYKQVPSVVGFSCQTPEDDVILLKIFSERSIRATFYEMSNDSITKIFKDVKYWKLGVFVDSRCRSTETLTSVFSLTADYKMYEELYNWMLIGKDLDDTLNFVNDEAFGLSTDFVIAVYSGEDNFTFCDVYNYFKDRGTELNITDLGWWNSEDGLTVSLTQSKFDRRANLNGIVLRFVLYKTTYKPEDTSLSEYLTDYQQGTKDGLVKFGYQLIKHMSDLYNFSIEAEESAKWLPGDKLGPMTWALMNNSVDMIGTPFSMSKLRIYLIKYVHQDWKFRTCFIFRSPQRTNIKIQEIFRPLADLVWYLMLITLMICFTILTIALHLDHGESILMRISDSMIIISSAMTQQGTDIVMRRLSTRIVFLCLMFFSLLMYNYYSASIVSARLDEPIIKINDSLNEFTKLNFQFATEWISYLEFFLKLPDWEIQQFYNKLWLKLPESKRYMDPEKGVMLVQKGGFAYHMHPYVGYPFIEKTYTNREICELMEVHLARPAKTAFAVSNHSPIVEIARVGLTRLSEVGLSNREENKWKHEKPLCRPDILSASSITIDEFSPHLIILMMGIIWSILVLFLEIMVLKYKNYRESVENRLILNDSMY